jgi:uncharacterized membrane protein YidH (DUF202 family)
VSGSPFDLFGAASLLAAVLVAAAALIAPFDHAAWLVAYLLLVGFAAQTLLGRGQATLAADRPAASATQLTLWNTGVVAVPAGVFLNARFLVVFGGLALLAGVVSFWRRTNPVRRARFGHPVLPIAYLLLSGLMAISACIGIALAWHRPWI